MNDAPDPSALGPTDLQRMTLAAYERSRRRFDAWCEREPPDNLAGDIDRAQLRHLRYRYRCLPMMGDAVEAMHLVGALARLDGGQTLDETDRVTYADIIGAWCSVLVHVGDLAGLYKLAMSPLLTLANTLAKGAGYRPSMMAACTNLSVITTARRDPARDAAHIDAERRAMFGALGEILTVACANAVIHQRQGGWPQDVTTTTFYLGAVEMMLGPEGG